MRCVCLVMLLAGLGCPTPAMPCNADGDCAPIRSRCDTTRPEDGAAGVCVPAALGPPVADSTSTGGPSSSASAPCAACAAGEACVDGTCRCTPEACNTGCCENDRCRTGDQRVRCGAGGQDCVSCLVSETCTGGMCVP